MNYSGNTTQWGKTTALLLWQSNIIETNANESTLKKFVKLFTQNFPYYLASFIFSSFCVHPVFVTKGFFFAVLSTFKTKKIYFFVSKIFFIISGFRVSNLYIFH